MRHEGVDRPGFGRRVLGVGDDERDVGQAGLAPSLAVATMPSLTSVPMTPSHPGERQRRLPGPVATSITGRRRRATAATTASRSAPDRCSLVAYCPATAENRSATAREVGVLGSLLMHRSYKYETS
jgi:hypothetical protein